MSTDSNKKIVRRYFEDVLDQRNLDVLDEIVAADCMIHRPEAFEPIRVREAYKHALKRILDVYSEFATTCRLSHRAVNLGEWTSRLGTHKLAGKTVTWPAIAVFRIRDGQIAEEWVSRDELGMLIQLGVLASTDKLK